MRIEIKCPGCKHFVGELDKLMLDRTFRLEKVTCGRCKYQFSLVNGKIRKFVKSTDEKSRLCWVSGDRQTNYTKRPLDRGVEECYYEIVVSDDI